MKKQFQSKAVPRGTRTIWRYLGALFILFTFAIGNVWADSETVPKTTDNWTGTSCSLTHAECANGSTSAQKDGDASSVTYIKFRTNKNGNTMTFEVNEGYKVTGFSMRGFANDNSKAVGLTSVKYDSADPIEVNQSFPNKNAGTTYTYSNTTDEATSAIVLSFGTNAGTQIMAVITITYEEVGEDTEAPTLSSSTPSNSATDVAVSGNIVLTFSENVTVNDASKFTISPSTGVTLSTPSVSGAVVTIPYSGLANNTIYTFSTAAEAVEDAAGNKSAALEDIAFTTKAAPVATTPSFTSPASEPAAAEYHVGDVISALEVEAAGYPTPTLQWYSNDSKSTTGATAIDGATNASYTPSNASESDLYYYCVASNSEGTVQSEYFHVTVLAALPPCYSFTPSTDKTDVIAVDEVVTGTTTGTGTMIVFSRTSGKDGIKYSSNGIHLSGGSADKLKVTLGNNLQENSVITFNLVSGGSGARGLKVYMPNGSTELASVGFGSGAANGDEDSFTYTVTTGSNNLIGKNEFVIGRNNTVYLKSITVSNCGAELHALTSAVSVEGKATVTLSKSLIAEGGTATATYSAIDAAYDFDEWEISGATIDNAQANPVTITMGSTDAVITLKLKAASVKHTVTYYDGATELGTELVEEGSNPTGAGLAPHKLGYTFGGWSTTDGEPAVALNTISVAANMPLYAVWSAIDCASKTGTIYTMEIAVAPAANCTIKTASGFEPALDLYQYEGIVGGEAMIGNTGGSNNCILQTNKTILLKDNDSYLKLDFDCPLKEGDKIQSNVTGSGKAAYISTANTRPDESGALAILANSTTGEITVPAALNNAQTVYIWKGGGNVTITSINIVRPVKYAVTFNMHDHGTAPDAQSIVEGGKVTEPSAPTAEGWSFGGWYKEDTYDNAWDFATDVVGTSAVELHAKWTAWPTMTLNRGAATSGDDVVTSVEPGSAVTVPACPFSYTDYNFNGWEYSPVVTVENGEFTMPSENLTLTAQWVDANNVAQIGSTKYETFAEAAAAVADGETIQLLQDCDYDATWTITGMAVTLDLNGKNLTGPASGDAVAITTDGVLTIMDGTATVDPYINGSNEITYAAGKFTGEWLINVYAGGSFVMNSGWLLAGEAAAWVTNSGIVTVNNGVLEALTNAVVMGPGNAGKGGYTMNIHGGILLGHMSASGIANGYSSMAVYHPNTGTLNIDGGTLISENGPGVVVRGGASNITGGTIIAQGNGGGKCGDANAPLIGAVGVAYDFKANYPGVSSVAATISGTASVSGADGAVQAIYAATEPTATEEAAVAISGGTFNTPVAEALCADDYYPATKPSGKYGVTVAALSVNFAEEAAKTEGQKAWTTFLTDNHYDYNLGDGGEISWDKANAYDTGLKLKKSTNNAIYFTTEPGKLIELTVGNIAGMNIQINGGAAQTITGGTNNDNLGVSYYYSDNAQSVVLKETSGNSGYNMLKSINIRDPYTVSFDVNGGDAAIAAMQGKPSVTLPLPTKGTDSFIGWFDAAEGGNKIGEANNEYTPTADIELFAHWEAISTDARLASITLDPSTGVLEPAFDPEVVNYTYTMPYGTAAIPQITGATAVSAKAKAPVIDAQATAWGETAVIRGVAESDDSKAYNITMVQGPKDGTLLVKAELAPGSSAASISATSGAFKDDANIAINIKKDLKLGSTGNYVKVAIDGANFQNGDVVEITLASDKTASAWLQIFTDEGTTMVAEMTSGVSREHPNYLTISGVPANTKTLYLYRTEAADGNMNPYPTSMAVYRTCAPILNKVTVAGVDGTPDNTNHIAIEVPFSTLDAALDAIAYDWVSNDAAWTAAHNPAVANAWEWGVENTVTLTDKDNDQSVYYVTISKAVASTDATLSALTVNGQAIALADGVFEYSFELPYGTTVAPTVVATPNHVAAVATVDPCTVNGATITVVPESGAGDQKVYTLTFTISAWKEIAIWDGSTMSAVATSPDATGLAWATTGFGSIANYNTTCGEKSYTKVLPSGGAATSRYMTITVPKDYVAKFYVVMASHSDGTERGMFIGSNLVKDPDATSILELSNNDRDVAVAGMSEIVGEGTYYINPNASIDFQEIRAYVRKGYARTSMLGNGVYGTVCVPNNVAIEDIQGVTVYELMGRDYTNYGKLAFDEIVSGELEAGVPYVFQAQGDKMIMFYGETHVDDPVDNNGMYGTFTAQVLTELDDVYYFAQRALWSCDDLTELILPANRAYVKLSEVGEVASPTPAPGRIRMTMNVNGAPSVITGCENLDASETPVKVMIDGQMFILCGEKMYDATGRLVK